MKNKLTIGVASLFTMAMLFISAGCSTPAGHRAYFLGKPVMSQADNASGTLSPQERCPPSDGEILAWRW